MFSQTTEYALRAMALLAYHPSELVPTPELAEKTQVPANYLAKVLQQLAQADLITGRRGVGGGYKLAKPAESIKLVDVIRTVGTIERITTCPLGLENHGSNLCALHRCMDSAAKAILDVVEGVTLADLVADSNGTRPLCDPSMTAALSISISKKS